MNYLGYNRLNFVDGDAGIDNGTLEINDYILPSVAGASGDVLTMDANGQNTSFQPAGGGATTIERPIQNLFSMLTPRTSYTTGNPDPYQVSSSGSNIIDTADFDVGDVIRVRAEGYYVNTAPDPVAVPCTIQHQWFISYPNTSVSDETLSTPVQFNGSGGNWFNEIIFTWESASSVRITFNGKINYNTGFAVSDDVRALNWFVGGAAPPGTERPKTAGAPYYIYPPPPIFEIRGQNLTVSGSGYSIATNYYIDKMNTDALVSGGGSPTIDHLALSNLNAGDAGHAQFALLQGRSGSQILSGGVTSAETLTLKSHTASTLNNIVIKDLNSTFEKNIDMNQNQINDVSLITNTTAPLGLIGQSGTSAAVLDPDPSNSFNVLGQSDIKLQSNTDVILQSSTGFVDLNSNITRVNVGGIPKLQVDASETTSSNNINMGDNEIQNLAKITSSANLTLTPSGNVVCSNDLDMSNNQINNVARLDSGLSTAVLNVVGRDRVDIGIGGGGRMEIEDTRVLISQFANLDIQSKVIYVQPNTMPSGGLFQADTAYIFVGSRTTATSFTLPANCKIMGTGKNNSFINYTGTGSLFISTDNNLDVSDITFTSSDNAGRILSAINLGQDKTLNMTRVQIRNAKNGMAIVGYDLVDLNNCLFTFFESGSATPIGVNFNDNSKVQFSSCEFLRWFQEGGTPATTAFTGNMLQFGGALNALNINGGFFHPQYDQNGIDLSALTSVIEGTITSNTFIDINLNSPTFQVLVPPSPTLAANYVIESNSIYPNLKSQVTYVLSAVNTTATDLSVNNPNVINHNNLALPLAIQFATIGTNGLITYTKKRSSNFMIVATCNIELVSGTNNRIGLGLFVNGAEVPLAYSYVNLSAAGTANQKPATLSFTGQANLNDTFQLSVFNSTASNNVIVNDINFAGIEI